MGVAGVDPVGLWLEGSRNESCSKPDTNTLEKLSATGQCSSKQNQKTCLM